MGKVALVFPYVRTRSANEMLFPPLGIATLAAHLRARGIETRVFDCTFSDFATLRAELKSYRPDIVGISSMVSLSRNTFAVAAMVREVAPDALLVAGGALPTVFPRRFAKHFDVVFRGEADLSFPRFCADVFARRVSPRTMARLPLVAYDGLFVPNHGLCIDNPTTHHNEAALESFPRPDRSDFDHAAYQDAWLRTGSDRITSLMVTLGCPFACDFCSKPVFGNVVRRRSLDWVFAEIDEIAALGYDGLWIADDTFTLDLSYLEEFCRRMAGRGLTWSCLSRARGIRRATVRLMKEAGCRRVYLGLESGSQATLALMNKQVTVGDGIRAVSLYREAGIEVAGFFIVGYPGETVASVEQTFALALTLPLDEISFNVPFPLPGSMLFRRLGGPDDGLDWNEENETTFVYPSQFDADWLRGRIAETMAAFAENRRARRRERTVDLEPTLTAAAAGAHR
jgi:anaerobic magnesium-protoporphyrin IX monomethyl ester cyclase